MIIMRCHTMFAVIILSCILMVQCQDVTIPSTADAMVDDDVGVDDATRLSPTASTAQITTVSSDGSSATAAASSPVVTTSATATGMTTPSASSVTITPEAAATTATSTVSTGRGTTKSPSPTTTTSSTGTSTEAADSQNRTAPEKPEVPINPPSAGGNPAFNPWESYNPFFPPYDGTPNVYNVYGRQGIIPVSLPPLDITSGSTPSYYNIFGTQGILPTSLQIPTKNGYTPSYFNIYSIQGNVPAFLLSTTSPGYNIYGKQGLLRLAGFHRR